MTANYTLARPTRKAGTNQGTPNRTRHDDQIADWFPDGNGRIYNRALYALIAEAVEVVEGELTDEKWMKRAGRVAACGLLRRLRMRVGDDDPIPMFCHNTRLCPTCRKYRALQLAPLFAAHALLLRAERPDLGFASVTLTLREVANQELEDADALIFRLLGELCDDPTSEWHRVTGIRCDKHYDVTHRGRWWPHGHATIAYSMDDPIDWDRAFEEWTGQVEHATGARAERLRPKQHCRDLMTCATNRAQRSRSSFDEAIAVEVSHAVYYAANGPWMEPADRWFAFHFTGNHSTCRGNMRGAQTEEREELAAELIERGVFPKRFVSPRLSRL